MKKVVITEFGDCARQGFCSLVSVHSLHLLQFLFPVGSKTSSETLPNYRKMGMIPALNQAPHPGFDLIGSVNTSAFVVTNPTDETI